MWQIKQWVLLSAEVFCPFVPAYLDFILHLGKYRNINGINTLKPKEIMKPEKLTN
jgi:hypothetical protein